jgi:hypothetical protein
MQAHLCLSEQYKSCAIFQQVPAIQIENKESSEEKKDADSRLEWMSKARPALLTIPIILLIAAALIWWPAPGTRVEDNTINAAPLQKITSPSEEGPAAGAAVDDVDSRNGQAGGENDFSAVNSNQSELESASQADGSPDSTVENDESADPLSDGFRVLTYD